MAFSNLNSTKSDEMNDLSVPGLWCEGAFAAFAGGCGRRAVGTAQHSEMFRFRYSLPHYFTQSFGYVSSLYRFLMLFFNFFFLKT